MSLFKKYSCLPVRVVHFHKVLVAGVTVAGSGQEILDGEEGRDRDDSGIGGDQRF